MVTRREPGLGTMVASAVLLGTAACGDDQAPPPSDAAPGADGATTMLGTPNPPAPPELPCAPGWRMVTVAGDPPTCDPWPESGRATCADDEAQLPGEPACSTVGSPCPGADPFAEDLPSDRVVVYALAGTTAGDGTRASPYARIRDAARAAGADGVAAVGRGSYDEIVDIPAGVTVWGACVADTVLTSTVANETLGVVTGAGDGAVVCNLSIRDPERAGIFVLDAGRSLHVEDVVVQRARGRGINVSLGGRLTGGGVVVRDTRPAPSGSLGRGLELGFEADGELRGAVLERNLDFGVFASMGSAMAVLEDVVVADTQPRPVDGLGGRGIDGPSGVQAVLRRSVVVNNSTFGLYVGGAGSTMTVEDSMIAGTVAEGPSGGGGIGVTARRGAALVAARTVVEGNRTLAVALADEGTTTTLSDVVVRDTQSEVARNGFGRGLEISFGAVVDLARVHVARNRDASLFVSVAGTEVRGEDLAIVDTRQTESDGTFGRGVNAQDEGMVEITRLAVERSRTIGVYVGAGAVATLSHLVVRETESRVADGMAGRGINVEMGAAADLSDLVVSNSQDWGVFVAAGRATASRLVVDGVAGRTCASDASCIDTADAAFGSGLGAFFGDASLSATDFSIQGVEECGVHVGPGGGIDLSRGEVIGAPIGACVQVDGYDLDRLTDGVTYRDNGINLDSTMLPVPEAVGGLPGS